MTSEGCQECGSTWEGYHSFMFCRLIKTGFGGMLHESIVAAMAKTADSLSRAMAENEKRATEGP